MAKYGLVGRDIAYSFSKTFFTVKFEQENKPHSYHNFDIECIEKLTDVLSNNPGLSLIFFHAEWCSHCLSMTPIYQALQERWDGGRVYRANFDLFINDNAENSAMNVIIQEHVPALPTSVLLDKNMCVLGTYVGVISVNDLYKNIELDTTLDTQCVMRTRYSFD